MMENTQDNWIAWIEKRSSIRTYQGIPLDAGQKGAILSLLDDVHAPFAGDVRFGFVDAEGRADMKLGTYGVIKEAKSFLVSAVKESPYDMETLGYFMEAMILKATGMGLGTCWLAGTFNRKDFGSAIGLTEDEHIPAVTPIGQATADRRMVDKVMRSLVGATKRKPWHELFFDGSFESPLKEGEAGDYAKVLEMVRIGPSASNKQPWRVLSKDGKFHFYLSPAKNYPRQAQRMDMGIALCHFEMTAKSLGLSGTYVVEEPSAVSCGDCIYLATWEPKTV